MVNITDWLGGHPLPGVLVVLVGAAAFLLYEYLNVRGSATRSKYMPIILGVAMATTVISLVLMGSRFITVVGL
jgi:hypothetical protein